MSSVPAAIAAYSTMHVASAACDQAGARDLWLLLERVKPAWSWGIMVFALNGWAPIGAKLLAGVHGLGVLMTASTTANEVTRRFLHFPAAASLLALGLSASLGTTASFSGLTASTILLLHLASVVHEAIWRMTLPAPLISHFVNIPMLQHRHRESGRVELLSIPSSQAGIVLSGARVKCQSQQVGRPPRVVLYIGGNGELWEHGIIGVGALAHRVGADGVQVNFRGVGTSTGIPLRSSMLVQDAIDTIEYLVKTTPGLTKADICLFGHSIGGGVAAQVVATKCPECPIVIDRSFSSLADAAYGISGIGPAVTRPLMTLAFGLLDSAAVFSKIKHDKKVVTFHQGDRVIHYERASLARLPEFQRGGRYSDFAVKLSGTSSDPHNCEVTDLIGAPEVLRRMETFFRP